MNNDSRSLEEEESSEKIFPMCFRKIGGRKKRRGYGENRSQPQKKATIFLPNNNSIIHNPFNLIWITSIALQIGSMPKNISTQYHLIW